MSFIAFDKLKGLLYLLDEADHNADWDGDVEAADHDTEGDTCQVVEGANLTCAQTEGLEDGLEAVAHVHEEAADSRNVEEGANGVAEGGNDVALTISWVAIDGQLP